MVDEKIKEKAEALEKIYEEKMKKYGFKLVGEPKIENDFDIYMGFDNDRAKVELIIIINTGEVIGNLFIYDTAEHILFEMLEKIFDGGKNDK